MAVGYFIAPAQWESALRAQHLRVAKEHAEYTLTTARCTDIRHVEPEYREAQGDQPAGWYGFASGEKVEQDG